MAITVPTMAFRVDAVVLFSVPSSARQHGILAFLFGVQSFLQQIARREWFFNQHLEGFVFLARLNQRHIGAAKAQNLWT
ncbi:MAG: hypothetical protein IPI20_11655 [Rhodoferax sp.]|nr:hypothetical protein [Rhodoferax sp.]